MSTVSIACVDHILVRDAVATVANVPKDQDWLNPALEAGAGLLVGEIQAVLLALLSHLRRRVSVSSSRRRSVLEDVRHCSLKSDAVATALGVGC